MLQASMNGPAARRESLASHRDGRGAPIARRDDGEYREHLTEEQRRERMHRPSNEVRLSPRAASSPARSPLTTGIGSADLKPEPIGVAKVDAVLFDFGFEADCRQPRRGLDGVIVLYGEAHVIHLRLLRLEE